MSGQFKQLNPERIEEQIDQLSKRVSERFPDSGLAKVSVELLEVSQTTKERAHFVAKPVRWLRLIIAILIITIIAGIVGTLLSIGAPNQELGFIAFIQLVESGLNDVVFIGIAIFFLVGLESRFKRHKALKAIDELRSLAHVIDMHQLTKDPNYLQEDRIITDSSPKINMNGFYLKRYLDYCSEMLSLTAKLSAIYAQEFSDPVVLNAVTEVENLTTGLSRKIWQKMIILNSMKA